MGYDIKRFEGTPSSQLICSICHDVYNDPVTITCCDHIFCRSCISTVAFSLDKKMRVCPLDRKKIPSGGIVDVQRQFKGLWSELKIKCNYADRGCDQVIPIEQLDSHTKNCQFNISTCHGNCGYRGPVSEDHNCIDFLKMQIACKDQIIDQMRQTIDGQNEVIQQLEETSQWQQQEPAPGQQTLFGRFRSSLRSSIRKLKCTNAVIEKQGV